jgi:hypothetical protein
LFCLACDHKKQREKSVTDIDDDQTPTDDGPKALRDALAKANARATELEAQVKKFAESQRQGDVAKALKDAGVNEGLAKFYSGDDSSPEAVTAWVKENSALFGLQTQAPVDTAAAAAAATIQQVLGQAPAPTGNTLEDQRARWANASDEDLFKGVAV